MAIPILGDIIKTVGDVVGQVVVDKDKRDEILLKLKDIEDRADQRLHEELMGQIEVNKIEATHANIFVSGWRPFIGWVSGIGVGWTFVFSPFVEFIARLFGWVGTMPKVDTNSLFALVTAMLGIGTMRSYEKVKGVIDSKKIKD